MNASKFSFLKVEMLPILGSFPAGCCARAASGHAAAAPPSATNNSRRPMVTVIRPSRARCVKGTIPRHERAVFMFERAALLLDVPHEPLGADLGPVNVALRIGDALGRASGGGLLHRIGDECRHDTITDSTDPNASLPAIMILCNRFRFGIGHVDDVVLVNEDAARPAKLEPLVDVVALLVKNLDT